VISAAENANKFQRTRFWKEKSVEGVVTLVPMAQATLLVYIIYAQGLTSMPVFTSRLHTSGHLGSHKFIAAV
jgi:hypothetical protein